MTTYTDPATIDTTSGTPITEQKMTALKDNPPAIAEGATGAPKIQVAALDPTVLIINDLSWGSVQTASGTTVLPLGLYAVASSGSATSGSTIVNTGAEYKINGVWGPSFGLANDSSSNLDWEHSVLVASDGTNARVINGTKYHKVL